jgi:hypothetical protein
VTTTPQPDRIDGAVYLRLVGLGAGFRGCPVFPAIFLGIALDRRLNPDPTAG